MSNCNCCCEIVKLTESSWFRNSPLKVEMFTIALLKHLLYLMNICNRCCENIKLIHSNNQINKIHRSTLRLVYEMDDANFDNS